MKASPNSLQLLLLCCLCFTVRAENVVQSWARHYSFLGEASFTAVKAVSDPSGNVVVAGLFNDNTTSPDILLMKFSSGGVPIWTNRHYTGSAAGSAVASLGMDANGDVAVIGYVPDGGASDMITIKYSAAGVPLWTNTAGTSFQIDRGLDVVFDGSGAVFACGILQTAGDVITSIKYSATGLPLWTNQYGGAVVWDVREGAAAVDANNNLFVTCGAASLTNTVHDFVTIKYSPQGLALWTNRYDGPAFGTDDANKIGVDGDGNIFVAGKSFSGSSGYDYAIIKYSNDGVPLWTNRYDGVAATNDFVSDLAVASNGNVYVTGKSATGASRSDYVTVAYSSSGVCLWTNRFDGTDQWDDGANDLALDRNGNIIVTGYSYNQSTLTNSESVTLSYSPLGAALWTNRWNIGPAKNSSGVSVTADGIGDVFVLNSPGLNLVKYFDNGQPQLTNVYNAPLYFGAAANAIAVDAAANVFVTGTSSAGAGFDFATIAYSATGIALWTNRYDGPGHRTDAANAVVVDKNGSIIVTGYGGGTDTTNEYTTIKYSAAGSALWTNRYSGSAKTTNIAVAVSVDSNANIFVTGYSYNSTAAGSADYATIAYSAAGVALWTNRYNGTGNSIDIPAAMALDGSGNVLVTGYSYSSSSSNSADYLTIKYSGAGVPLWTNRYNGPGNNLDEAKALAVDDAGNVFVTGHSYSSTTSSSADYATIKYASSGVPLWTNRYTFSGSSVDQATGIAVNSGGTTYVTGVSSGDYLTIAYSGAGTPLWTNRFKPSSSTDQPTAILLDTSGNIFVTGYSTQSDSYNSIEVTYDYLTVKYSPNGAILWTNRCDGAARSDDKPAKSGMVLDPDGAVYVTGASDLSRNSTLILNEYLTIKLVSPPEVSLQPLNQTNTAGNAIIFITAANGSAPLGYQWYFNGVPLADGQNIAGATSNLLSISSISTQNAGSYAIVVTNAFGTVTSTSAVLTVLVPAPILLGGATLISNVLTYSFTNTPGVTFTVIGTTNLDTPLVNWTVIGPAVETSPGQFMFSNSITNKRQQFYGIRSP